MKGITWSRDSHGLFDYESRHLTKKTMKTEQEMLKYRNFGKKSLNEIKAKLEQLGLSLGQKINEGLLDKGVNA